MSVLPIIELKIVTRVTSCKTACTTMCIGYISYDGSKLYACIGSREDVEHQLSDQYHELITKFNFV